MCKFTKENDIKKEILQVFKDNTKDGRCAFVTLDFSEELIPKEHYIAISTTDCNIRNNDSFTGFLFDKQKVKNYIEKNNFNLLLEVNKDISQKKMTEILQLHKYIDFILLEIYTT